MMSKVYQLKYDTKVDKDIDDWLSGIPSSRKAELVRHAIRFYLNATGSSVTPALLISNPNQVIQEKEPQKEKRRPKMDTNGGF